MYFFYFESFLFIERVSVCRSFIVSGPDILRFWDSRCNLPGTESMKTSRSPPGRDVGNFREGTRRVRDTKDGGYGRSWSSLSERWKTDPGVL